MSPSNPDPAPDSGADRGRSPSPAAKIARAVTTTSISQLLAVAIGFFTSVAQARLLGAAGRGDVTRFVNAGALATLYFGLGINSAITYFVASGAAAPGRMLRSLRPTFVLTVVGVATCCGVATWAGLSRFLPEALGPFTVTVAVTAFFAFSQLSNWLAAVLAARGDFAPINRSTVATGAAAAAVSLLLLWQRPPWAGPAAIIALNVAIEGMRALMLAFARSLRSDEPAGAPSGGTEPARATGSVGFMLLVRYSGLTFLGEALQFLTYRFDMWVVDAYRGAADLGRYSLAVSLAQMVWIVPIAAARVMFPYAAMLSQAEGALLAWRAARVSLAVCALAALVGWAATQWLLVAVFGDQFAQVPMLLGILLLGIVPYSVAKVLGNYLAGINALGVNVLASGCGLVITIALDLMLIPRFGALGAAWATALSYFAFSALLYVVFLRKSGLTLKATLTLRWKA